MAFEDFTPPNVMAERPVGPRAPGSSRSHSSLEGVGIPHNSATRSPAGTRTPGSPGGSLGSSSVVSRGSDAGRSYHSAKRVSKANERFERALNDDANSMMPSI